jgi:hypothetical protein
MGMHVIKARLGKWIFGVLCGLLILGSANAAEPEPQAQASVRIERVALFKNGLGYFVATGTLPERETTIRIGQLPVPVYGTFWVGYSTDVKVKRLATALEGVEVGQPVQNVGQLLLANQGAHVVLRLGPGEKDVVEGGYPETGRPRQPDRTAESISDEYSKPCRSIRSTSSHSIRC